MSYQVKDYMIKEVNSVNIDTVVTEAAKVMAADKNLEGYTLVLKEGKPVGIVTERDIITKVLAEELDPQKTRVSEIMSIPLAIVDPDDDLLKASKLMQENNVTKLAVVRDDIIYGIITAKEIAQRCGEYMDRSIKDIIRWSSPLFM